MALQAYFDRQLETRRESGGKSCEGETICALTGPLRDKSRPIETICDGCALKSTKPGAQPGHLSAMIIEALRLDELKESGAVFSYPDALAPAQWIGIQALTSARRKDQEKDFQSRRKEQAQSTEQAALEARMARG